MVDVVDIAATIEAETIARGVSRAAAAQRIGAAGECEGCDWWMPRLVDGLCGFCRDGRPRPADWEPPKRPLTLPTSAPDAPSSEEEPTMADKPKSIMLPASAQLAIAEVERLAEADGVSLGAAAATLIWRGAQAPAAVATPGADTRTPRERMVALLDGVLELLIEQIEAADAPKADPLLESDRDAWKARAEAAEGRLAQMKALFA